MVENTADELVIASGRGKLFRTTVGQVPIRRREVRKGRLSKGARLMKVEYRVPVPVPADGLCVEQVTVKIGGEEKVVNCQAKATGRGRCSEHAGDWVTAAASRHQLRSRLAGREGERRSP